MINIFSQTFPTRCLLLEYSENQAIEDFDLSIPLTPGVIQSIIAPRYPELVSKLSELQKSDPGSGVMLDKFLSETNQPAVVTFRDPEQFFANWNSTGIVDDSKEFYAAVVYTGRGNLTRTVYRNAEAPSVKTDVYSGDGSFSHHEEIYTGTLPAQLKWAEQKLQLLREAGVDAKINHFKDSGEASKVYFLVEAPQG